MLGRTGVWGVGAGVEVVGVDVAGFGAGAGAVGAGGLGGCRPPPRTTAEGLLVDHPGRVCVSPSANLRMCARVRVALLNWVLNMCVPTAYL